jgi:hypothetical protein
MTKAALPIVRTATIQEALANLKGSSFIGLDTVTDVKLTGGKSNPFQGRVQKAAAGHSVQLFTNKNSNGYENMVKRRLEKEGKDPANFELSPRAWGKRIPNTAFVEHNGELYLEVIFLKAGDTTILLDNIPHAGDIPGMPVEKEASGQGGLENQVIVRTFKASSIKRLRFDHIEYVFN